MQLKHKVGSLLEQDWPQAKGPDADQLEQWKDISQSITILIIHVLKLNRRLVIFQEGLGQSVPFDLLMRKSTIFSC